jgi:hypothetical protein
MPVFHKTLSQAKMDDDDDSDKEEFPARAKRASKDPSNKSELRNIN